MLTDCVNCKIGDIVAFYAQYQKHIGDVFVKTRFGPRKILAAEVTAKDQNVVLVKTESNEIRCSPEHRFFNGDVFVYAKDLVIGQPILGENGLEHVTSVYDTGEIKDLVDIQVEEVEEYYSNGLVSHNSSIMTDSIQYALFGKPFRKINLPQLINSINQKDCQVELSLNVSGESYTIKRGMKPSKFEIYKGSGDKAELIKQEAATKDYQGYLEKNILKINHKTFVQILVLGSAVFTPFMQLPAGLRRSIIEDILDISVFSQMMRLLKEKIQKNKEETSLLDVRIQAAKNESLAQRKLIDTIQNKNSIHIESLQQELTDAVYKISMLKCQRVTISDLHYQLTQNLLIIDSDRLDELQLELSQLKRDIKQSIDKQNKISSIDTCPTCMQTVSDQHKSSIKSMLSTQYEIDKPKLAHLTAEIDVLKILKTDRDAQLNKLSDLKIELSSIDKQISWEQASIEEIEKKISASKDSGLVDIESEKDKLRDLAQNALKLIERKNELITEKSIQEVQLGLLKDSGIKAQIIKEYLPILNKVINKYLADFEFFINFVLDENFDEKLLSRGRDLASYNSLSEGEKKRIDIAILMAFRHIAAMKNSAKVDLLVLDELDSGLDSDSRSKLIDLVMQSESNVLMISHAIQGTEHAQLFDKTIHVVKKGDFSEITLR